MKTPEFISNLFIEKPKPLILTINKVTLILDPELVEKQSHNVSITSGFGLSESQWNLILNGSANEPYKPGWIDENNPTRHFAGDFLGLK